MTFPRAERRPRTGAALLGALVVLLAVGWMVWPDTFFPAYWFGLMIWMQLSIGCLILLLIQFLTDGEWGRAAAPLLRRGAAGIFLLAPLFLPVLFALPHLFSWTGIHVGISSGMLSNKQPWLNSPAFIARTFCYFVALLALAQHWRRAEMRPGEPGSGWAGPSIVAVVLVLSFGSSDWMMSLEPSFYSSMYPFSYFSDTMVSALSALCAVLAWGQERRIFSARPELLHALGKMLFAAVLFWGYITFAQFIIIWTGNLPDEAGWYIVRSSHGWLGLTLFVILLHFALPFCLLLSQALKKNARQLGRIATALFVIHFAEVYWLMAPKIGVHFHVHLFDLVMPVLIGACWIWFVTGLPEPAPAEEISGEAIS